MARPIILTGRTELLAAIYNGDNLPTAVICPKGHRDEPWCLHSLREGDESLFEVKLLGYARKHAGLKDSDSSKDDELQFELHRFFEDYPEQGAVCHGCHFNSEKNENVQRHKVRESESVCAKTTEDCA